MPRHVLLFLAFVSVCVVPLRIAQAKPNIVLIFIDDMGYGDVGPFGSTKNRTPQIDRMAAEGMKLTSFYAAPVCSVSRAQVMTGCYGQRVSISGVLFPGESTGISKDEQTVAELLKQQGYATQCVGKWHLGDQPDFLPTRHGFDEYFGLPYSNDMLKKAKVDGRLVVPLVRGEKVIELLSGEQEDQLTERYTDEAVKFLNDNTQRPFFLYLAHTAVHAPIHPGEKFRDKSVNGRYSDWVEEVDWSVGRVLDTLRELKLSENTLVIFTSDNGPAKSKDKAAGSAGPLRGFKGSTWEGGMREPTLAWWPGKIVAGSACDAVAGNIDFLPTFVTLAGGVLPTAKKIDGADFSPLLLNPSKQPISPRPAHFYYAGYKLEAVRVGPWKMAVAAQAEGMGKSGPIVEASLQNPRLYNLDDDIGETTDVAAKNPEVLARLKPLVVKMADELGNGKHGTEVRKPGFVANAVTLYPVDNGEKPKTPAASDSGVKASDAAAIAQMKVGDSLSREQAPQIDGRPFTVSCHVATKARDGVIVAHGGTQVGYAVYLKAGHVVFAVHASQREIVRIESPTAIGETARIEVRFAHDGGMTLSLDGKEVASGKAGGLIKQQPQEAFCVGHDDGNTVDKYDGKSLFDGSVRQLKIEFPAQK